MTQVQARSSNAVQRDCTELSFLQSELKHMLPVLKCMDKGFNFKSQDKHNKGISIIVKYNLVIV
jgi:hypothetical protein